MKPYGLGKFLIVGIGMLIVVTLVFDAIRWLYSLVFGTSIPLVLLFFLIGLSIFICFLSFVYRHAYEGYSADSGNRPSGYPEVCAILVPVDVVCFFAALVVLWYVASQWWGWIWVALYLFGEMQIHWTANRRLLAWRLQQVQWSFPEMSPNEQAQLAHSCVRMGMHPAEYFYGKVSNP